MVQANLRLAAGIGVVATCLLAGGLGVPVAMADPGGGHSGHSGSGKYSDDNGRGSDDDGKGSDDSSRQSSRTGSDRSDDSIDNDNINDSSRAATNSEDVSRPSSEVGSGREAGTSDQRPSSDFSPDPPEFKIPKVTFGDGRMPHQRCFKRH